MLDGPGQAQNMLHTGPDMAQINNTEVTSNSGGTAGMKFMDIGVSC